MSPSHLSIFCFYDVPIASFVLVPSQFFNVNWQFFFFWVGLRLLKKSRQAKTVDEKKILVAEKMEKEMLVLVYVFIATLSKHPTLKALSCNPLVPLGVKGQKKK